MFSKYNMSICLYLTSIIHAYLSRLLLTISFIFTILDYFYYLFWRRNFDARLPGFHIQSKVRKGVEVHGSVYCRSFPLNSYEAFKSIFFVFFFLPFFFHSIQVQIVIKVEPHPGCVK